MTNNTAELAVELAFRAYNQGNLALAEEKARQALYLQENIPDAVFLLGLIAKQAGALASRVSKTWATPRGMSVKPILPPGLSIRIA